MRAVKFRGKSKLTNEWVYGSLVITDNNTNSPLSEVPLELKYSIVHYCAGDWDMGGWETEEVYEDTIGQFTGVMDKDNNKIYEGDVLQILHFIDRGKKYYLQHVIEWSDRYTGYIARNLGNDTLMDNKANHLKTGNVQLWVYSKSYEDKIKIIGNIYDNKK
jgi:uncharacterized phage protein (TIGR01671 family)